MKSIKVAFGEQSTCLDIPDNYVDNADIGIGKPGGGCHEGQEGVGE